MRRTISTLICIMVVFALLSPVAYGAQDNSRSYHFQLTVNGGYAAAVDVGEEITITVKLDRTDAGKSGSYAMYSMQDEIIYDSTYFSMVENSQPVTAGYDFNVVTMDDGIHKRVILSRLSFSTEGIETPDTESIATFKLKALRPKADIPIISKNYKVNSKTANTYLTTANDVTVTIGEGTSGGGNSGLPGGGGGVVTPPVKPEPEKPVDVSITIKGTTATLDMEVEELSSLLKEIVDAGPVTLDLSDKKVSSLDIPSGALKAISEAAKAKEGLQVALPKGTIELDKVSLDELSKVTEKGNLKISIDAAKVLTPEQQVVVKDKPVYDIRVETDAGAVVGLKGKATIYLPCELKVGQSAAGVVVYYVDSDGSLVDMKAQYDPIKKMAYFTTNHLSVYMVAYDESLVKVSPADRYTDVDKAAWYYEAVEYALEKGLFVGTSDTTFSPNTAMSRAMLVTVLWRMEGEPAVTAANAFTDVVGNAWYAKPVLWANANNIVSGYGGGLFGPNDNITREQMAAVLNRYAGFKGIDVSAADSLAAYTDAGDVSDWALASLKWAVGEKLITGMTTTTLVPQGNATRAQVAAILMRYIENVVE